MDEILAGIQVPG